MNDIIITDFGSQHFEQALDVLYESNCMHARCDNKQFICAPKENSVPYVRSVLEDENKFGFVALDNNNVAGILFGSILERDENIYCNRRFCKVFDIAVSSKYTKRGIGKQLINAAAEYARSRNVRQIELEVFSFNTNAEAFYKRLNFREVSRIMSLEV